MNTSADANDAIEPADAEALQEADALSPLSEPGTQESGAALQARDASLRPSEPSTQQNVAVFDDPEDSHEFALRRASRYLSHVYSRRLDSLGLTTPQFTILRRLNLHGAMTMADLGQWVMQDRSTLVRAIQVLGKNGYVHSSMASSPKRRTLISLTALGAERLAQARVLWREAQHDFEAQFGAERANRLRKELFDLTGYQLTGDPL